jgi:predicted RNase H-like HicB family nuclease
MFIHQQQFTAIYCQDKDYFLGWVEEIPGVNTQGKTLEEAKENLKEALELILETNREISSQRIINMKIIKEPILLSVR